MKLRRIPWIPGGGMSTSQQEEEIYQKEKRKELLSIVHQPHRTFPSIQPKPKPRHDYPQGSYLKYVTDPTWNQSYYTKTPTINVDQILTNVSFSVSFIVVHSVIVQLPQCSVGRETVVSKQYNSPINVYSNDSLRHEYQNCSSVPPLIRPQQPKTVNFANSPTYKMVVEESEQQQFRSSSPFAHHHQQPTQSSTFQTLMNHYR